MFHPKVQEAIKTRKNDYEVTGKALTEPFLAEMERQYKHKYLRDISTHAELLVYDWTGGGEVEVVRLLHQFNFATTEIGFSQITKES